MSVLIEKLKQKVADVEAARGPAKHIHSDRLADLGQVAWDHWEEIVQALETVRGIKKLAESGFVMIQNGIANRWYVTTSREWRSDQQETDGPTLSAAIEAARKGM